MPRIIRVAGAQLGPTQRADSRAHTMARLLALLEQAAAQGAKLVVFPELAFTTFFPRWWMEHQADVDQRYFEPAMPSAVSPFSLRSSEFRTTLPLGGGVHS